MQVWQTSNLRRLRLGEEKKKKKDEERRTNHIMKIYMVSLFHRATIKYQRDLPCFVRFVSKTPIWSAHSQRACETSSPLVFRCACFLCSFCGAPINSLSVHDRDYLNRQNFRVKFRDVDTTRSCFLPNICCRPSVCLSSVTLGRPTQAVQIFRNISTAFGTLAIP